MWLNRIGGVAALVFAVVLFAPEAVYLSGDLRAASGPLSYMLADFLYGPVKAVCLVLCVYALRNLPGVGDTRPMRLALPLSLLTALLFLTVAVMRGTNRSYHLAHPELNLENAQVVLTVWATQVSAATGTAWHGLGWLLLLIGWAGLTGPGLARALCVLCALTGGLALAVYAWPEFEAPVILLSAATSIGLGATLLRSRTASA
jgi:hypothetical protein